MTSEASDAESRDSHESCICEDEFQQNEECPDQKPRVEFFGIACVSDRLDFRLFEFIDFRVNLFEFSLVFGTVETSTRRRCLLQA